MKKSWVCISFAMVASGSLAGCTGVIGAGQEDGAKPHGAARPSPSPTPSEGGGEGEGEGSSPAGDEPGGESLPTHLEEPPLNTSALFDDKYYDGHACHGEATPILPPGEWDWDAADSDLANWKNFSASIGHFTQLTNGLGTLVGWSLAGNAPDEVNYSGAAAYFHGSPGVDVLDLGPRGHIHSLSGSLGCGGDVLIFNASWSVDFSTSAADCDPSGDDDVVVAGCDANHDAKFDIKTTSIHTGRGRDGIFARDAERSAFDAGNLGGNTSLLDPDDGDDVAVLRGNMRDFRFFGGTGDDTAVWYVDEEHQKSAFLGPNFFGGGGSGGALWGDTGIDRLVLVIPTDTEIVTSPPASPGQLLVHIESSYKPEPTWDGPTKNDPLARYCITCGSSPEGRKTMTLEYRSKDDKIRTGYFYVTAFEELQIGVGASAAVYTMDDKTGKLSLDVSASTFEPPPLDASYCAAGTYVMSGILP